MGTSYYPRLVIGASLSPDDLRTVIPGAVVCPKGHPPQGGPFCSKCGAKLEPQLVSSFKPAFMEFVKKQFGIKAPEELFNEWNDSDGSTSNLRFHIVDPTLSGEDWGCTYSNYVLGYRLLEYECSEYRGKGLFSVDLDRLEEIKKTLFEVICALDYTSRDIKLYLCTYVSC